MTATPRRLLNSADVSLLRFATTSSRQTARHIVPVRHVNRPGMSGDSTCWEGWSHVRWFVEEVPAGVA